MTYGDEDEDFIWSLFTVEVGWKKPKDQSCYDNSLGNRYHFLDNRDYVKDTKNYEYFSFSGLSEVRYKKCKGHFPLLNWLTDRKESTTCKLLIKSRESYKGFKSLMDRLTECSIG